LHDLRGDYQTLVGRVDWASKLWLLDTFREAEQMTWEDPALKSLDLEYHNLHQGKGLYYGLMDEGRVPRLITDKTITLAMGHPPRNTRAFGRGELVRHLLACGSLDEAADPKLEERFSPSYVINWSIFQLLGHAPFPMPDPFKTYVQEVRAHLQSA
jgi:proteasome accessory factor A